MNGNQKMFKQIVPFAVRNVLDFEYELRVEYYMHRKLRKLSIGYAFHSPPRITWRTESKSQTDAAIYRQKETSIRKKNIRNSGLEKNSINSTRNEQYILIRVNKVQDLTGQYDSKIYVYA